MKKFFGVAFLGSALAGGSGGALFAFLSSFDRPPQAVSRPVVTNSQPSSISEANFLSQNKQLQEVVTDAGVQPRFERVMQYAQEQKLSDRPIGEIMQAIATQFLGASYKKNLLDESPEEKLFISLDKFDCVLFVETVLAIARGVATQDYAYDRFVDRVRDERYRNGEIRGYCSRLHYFSDWIYDNQNRNNVANFTESLGGISLNKKLNFMSSNRQLYPQIAKDDLTYQCFVDMENRLSELNIKYIPKGQIRRVYSQLQPGDIVAVATSVAGLDVTHTGLVYRNPNGNLGIIHASPAGRVTIARDLQLYVGNINNAIGIIVARPNDPRQNSNSSN